MTSLRSPAVALSAIVTVAGIRPAAAGPDVDAVQLPAPHNSITVIAHGFQADGQCPAWMTQMKEALEQRGISDVLIVDWAAESNDAACGWAEAAADRAFARLLMLLMESGQPRDVHFIGHSRGAVVCSEIQRRLCWYEEHIVGIDPLVGGVRVTLLDPHAANGQVGQWCDASVKSQLVELFESLVQDPEPVIWPNTSHAELFFQRSSQATLDCAGVNPWGDGTVYGVNVVHDLTGLSCLLPGYDGAPAMTRILHCEVPLWYASSITSEQPLLIEDGVLSGCGYLVGAPHYGERETSELFVSTLDSPETVFNGDFRFHSRTHPMFRRMRERNRIPGWHSNGRMYVTPDERLRISAEADESGAVTRMVHEPLVLPGGAALSFDVLPVEISGECFLKISAAMTGGGESRELGSWRLDSAIEALRLSVPLGLSSGRISMGSFQIELESSAGGNAEIELDNVMLTAPIEAELAVR